MNELKPSPLAVKRLLVAMDLTHMDTLLLQYIAFLKKILPDVQHIVLFHNIWFDDDEKAEAILESLDRALEDILHEKIDKLAKEYLGDIAYSVEITQKDDTAHALKLVQKKENIHLTLFGKKVAYEGSGYLIERMLHHKSESHLMVVPETAYHTINHILVPLDFSKKSALALIKARQMAAKTDAKISCQHVYAIPRVYFPYVPVQNLKVQTKKKMEEAWQRFQQKYFKGEPQPDITFSFHAERSVARIIYDHALKAQVDLITISTEVGVINSTLIQLLKLNMHFPLFIVNK